MLMSCLIRMRLETASGSIFIAFVLMPGNYGERLSFQASGLHRLMGILPGARDEHGETADKSDHGSQNVSLGKKNHEGPVFKEPWQAQAFAMAVTLSEAGLFSWQEWSSELSVSIQSRQKKGIR